MPLLNERVRWLAPSATSGLELSGEAAFLFRCHVVEGRSTRYAGAGRAMMPFRLGTYGVDERARDYQARRWRAPEVRIAAQS